MSSPGNTFNAPDNDQVPYTIALTNPDGSPYALQSGDLLALSSTDGHSTVTPNASDPTGATGVVTDTAAFVGPVSGNIAFAPGAAAAAAGIQPATGTWTGTWDAVTKTLGIAVTFGTPAPVAAPAAADVPANLRNTRP
jgi:hypothetical protein